MLVLSAETAINQLFQNTADTNFVFFSVLFCTVADGFIELLDNYNHVECRKKVELIRFFSTGGCVTSKGSAKDDGKFQVRFAPRCWETETSRHGVLPAVTVPSGT